MTTRIGIIDYGSGNLHSVQKAFEQAARNIGQEVRIRVIKNSGDVLTFDRLVLPGVGAFPDCWQGLVSIDGMMEALEEAVRVKSKPFFGICVGMQLMASVGYEKRPTKGLNWIAGRVERMRSSPLKIPHIGWNTLRVTREHPLFANIATGSDGLHAYFVHSFAMYPEDLTHQIAVTDYGTDITAAVVRENMFGTQFHPEKSQQLGLKLIANFLRWHP